MEGKSVFNLIARAFQFFWALLVLALMGNVVAEHGGHSSSIVNYTVFTAAFALLSLFVLIPATVKDLGLMGFIPFALDLLNVLFWFCGAVALAAELGVHSCNNNVYVSTNKVIRGAGDLHGVCREAQASTAFLWFGFAAFLVSAVFTGTSMSGGSVRGGGIRRGPAMSQV